MRIGITERGDAGLDKSWKSFKADGKILITKRPDLLVDEDLPEATVIHCTITGMGTTCVEPNVPHSSRMLQAYQELFNKYGPERVVLRVDPLIPAAFHHEGENSPTTNFYDVFNRPIFTHLQPKGRVRISFLDNYPHMRARGMWGLWEGLHIPLKKRQQILDDIKTLVSKETIIEICGEPGMPCTGCVSIRDLKAMNLNVTNLLPGTSKQRVNCLCLAEKAEMLKHRGQCANGCLYCYWR